MRALGDTGLDPVKTERRLQIGHEPCLDQCLERCFLAVFHRCVLSYNVPKAVNCIDAFHSYLLTSVISGRSFCHG